jgi:hypothetical protein
MTRLPQLMDRSLAVTINTRRAQAMINSMLSKMSEPGLHDPTERIHVSCSDDAGHSDLTNVHSVRDIAGILAAQGDVGVIYTSRTRDVAALFKLMRDIGP